MTKSQNQPTAMRGSLAWRADLERRIDGLSTPPAVRARLRAQLAVEDARRQDGKYETAVAVVGSDRAAGRISRRVAERRIAELNEYFG